MSVSLLPGASPDFIRWAEKATAATAVEYFVKGNEHSLHEAMLRALEKVGVYPKH